MIKYLNTLFGLLNAFIVTALGLVVMRTGSLIEPPQSYIIGGFCMLLGLCGIIFAYVDRFKKVKVPANPKKKK